MLDLHKILTEEHLKKAGISVAGHRRRLLAYLEYESKRPRSENFTSFSCCSTPKVFRDFTIKPNLHEWLEKLSLGHLMGNFEESGYDNLEHLLFMMNTEYALNDFILKTDVRVEKLGHRHRILAKLRQDSFVYNRQKRSNIPGDLVIHREVSWVGCNRCALM